MSLPPPIVLSFAASDPSGGAGIQADILTLAGMGCHPLTVLTAVTVQDTTGVEDIFVMDAEWVIDQARTVLQDMPVQAFKIGMLGSVEIVAAIAEVISDYPDIPLVLDPVLASSRGDMFANEEVISAMREMLFSQATIITPNSFEARRIALDHEDDPEILGLKQSADQLLQWGCSYVLIKGAHENTPQVVNVLYDVNGIVRSDAWQRLPGSFHGSGCTLSSAIAASLAHGMSITDSVYEAQEFTWHTLKAGFRPGMGQYIPDRFFWMESDNLEEEAGGSDD
ncbi:MULTISPECIES: bifunctional hydroxymethylpyrimidine kinase/phosphomethylpyrimidine kinase [Nitrosomonas]|uniref:hydroxymethylpyrimidine kinase n=2 Tax=Nitrosomonas eutropha TaxID=916 RepID=A0ABX5MAP1_9PROT|nr:MULTISPECIES: hydroxymethylpyrimidine/phosphomethylpyrimidine kinase [Nitrosomonas]ABI59783.1 Phosphomethylpyrimidine kinase [Nitrosomonas eutropha C91]MXS80280.1 hydroxymethylpyrimidine/phosphomethylpyrimidine kinase [Nitrosomonas sp. GH22]PXV83628.1 hydroxymethylpyrimidine/phosphomethylpyrimidine kinase [Nitrosomonas eutropha]SCX00251.1 hydroxymethylpyrimidine/phosphomethylpyrimidine kinase [Nitrosomonas eutropha]SDW32214.1 hydroxymethylpyrimidine/phosphomethylpyrimidine kinase [Nitrosomo